MITMKGIWEVTAGIVPGISINELSKSFVYTSEAFEKDIKLPQEETTRFRELMDEAHDYARSISDPGSINWVSVDFMWV